MSDYATVYSSNRKVVLLQSSYGEKGRERDTAILILSRLDSKREPEGAILDQKSALKLAAALFLFAALTEVLMSHEALDRLTDALHAAGYGTGRVCGGGEVARCDG